MKILAPAGVDVTVILPVSVGIIGVGVGIVVVGIIIGVAEM
jgi:hypothetical protein